MFLPESLKGQDGEDAAERQRIIAIRRIEQWALELVPQSIRTGVQVSAQEVVCGDPNCSPKDTVIVILFPGNDGRGMMSLPMEASDVTIEDLKENFPTIDVLKKWANGEEAEWPPFDMENVGLPDLRFDVGARVDCRIGPDEVTGWVSGIISQLWYRESSWAEDSFAPYKIDLDDGRSIFAPADVEMVIRLHKS